MKNFLILGADSRLGRCFRKAFEKDCVFLNKNECDITNPLSVKNVFEKHASNYVLNFAAMTDIEKCEKQERLCMEINLIGPVNLNKLCIQSKRKFIQISSDYAKDPTNVYGLSKYLAEKIISDEALIIRTSFYDELTYIVEHLLNNSQINAYTNRYYNPISVIKLVEEIAKYKDKSGIINIFSDKKINSYDFAILFAKIFEKDKRLIKKAIYMNNNQLAKRPLSSFIKPDIKVNIEDDLKGFKRYLGL